LNNDFCDFFVANEEYVTCDGLSNSKVQGEYWSFSMAIALTVLDTVTIATPCTVSWDGMQGDDRIRFCTKCSSNVHDISEMTAAEAIQLLNAKTETPCIRLYRRPDGRVVTSDCPKTLREKTWKWLGRKSSWAASLFAMMFLSGCMMGASCPTTKKTTEASKEPSDNLSEPREGVETAPMPHEPNQAKPSRETSTDQ
jgi:hypothetical protein